jgi:hypothetical protein
MTGMPRPIAISTSLRTHVDSTAAGAQSTSACASLSASWSPPISAVEVSQIEEVRVAHALESIRNRVGESVVPRAVANENHEFEAVRAVVSFNTRPGSGADGGPLNCGRRSAPFASRRSPPRRRGMSITRSAVVVVRID